MDDKSRQYSAFVIFNKPLNRFYIHGSCHPFIYLATGIADKSSQPNNVGVFWQNLFEFFIIPYVAIDKINRLKVLMFVNQRVVDTERNLFCNQKFCHCSSNISGSTDNQNFYPVRSLAHARDTSPEDRGTATSNGIYFFVISGYHIFNGIKWCQKVSTCLLNTPW